MSRSQRWIPVFAAALLLLAGCTATPGETVPTGDTGAQTGAASPGVSSEPSDDATDPADSGNSGGSDTPIPQTGDEPASILPLSCGELAAAPQVQAAFHAPVTATITSGTAPANAVRAAFLQAGGLYCGWSGSGGTGLQVGVVADAASNYAQRVAAATGSGFHDDTLGDASHVTCAVSSGTSTCSGDILVGDYWISGVSKDTGASSEAAAFDAYSSVMSTIASAVAGAGNPRGEWISPSATGLDASYLCASPVYPAAALGSGSNGFVAKTTAHSAASQSGLMADRAGSDGCTWVLLGKKALIFTFMDGGAWAYQRMAAKGVGVPVESDFDGAVAVCADMCTAYVSWHGGLLTVQWLNSVFPASETGSYLNDLAAVVGT